MIHLTTQESKANGDHPKSTITVGHSEAGWAAKNEDSAGFLLEKHHFVYLIQVDNFEKVPFCLLFHQII